MNIPPFLYGTTSLCLSVRCTFFPSISNFTPEPKRQASANLAYGVLHILVRRNCSPGSLLCQLV